MNKLSIPWGRLGVEMFVIVASVLLALLLDDWRQDRDRQQVLQAIKLQLLIELEGNQRSLEVRLPYHESMLDTFRLRADQILKQSNDASGSISSSVKVPPLTSLGFKKGLAAFPFKRNAWEAARSSTATTQMDVDLVVVLSMAYSSQAEVSSITERLREKLDRYVLASVEGERPAFALVDFTSTLSDLVLWERDLCNDYQILGRKLTGRNVDRETRCGSGNVTFK